MTHHEVRDGREGPVPRGRHPGPTDRPPRTWSTPEPGRPRLGGALMTVIGAFGVVEGVIALLAPTVYTTIDGTVQGVDLGGWACIHLVVGALVLVLGLCLCLGPAASNRVRGVGSFVVALNALVQLAWLAAFPIWAVVMVVLDVLVLCALITTRDEQRGGWGDRPLSRPPADPSRSR